MSPTPAPASFGSSGEPPAGAAALSRAEARVGADDVSREALHLIAEGITQLVGFDVAAVSVIRDVHELQVVAVAGSDEARSALDGTVLPVELVWAELERADDWGCFKFVPQDRRSPGSEGWTWTPYLEPSDDPDAWQPEDLLLAPLLDQAGVLQGLLSIDCPSDGRRPDLAQRRVLERYAAQAARAVVLAVERDQLGERVRMLSAARDIVRSVSNEAGAAIGPVRDRLIDCFRARGLWVYGFGETDLEPGVALPFIVDGEIKHLPARLVAAIEAVGVESWSVQQVSVLGGRPDDVRRLPRESDANVPAMLEFMEHLGIGTVLLAPLGAGAECLGVLVIARGPHDPDWTDLEVDTALEIGADLGSSLLRARLVERERTVVRDLRALDKYKSDLITTLSHELKSPLAVMLGNLELLDARRLAVVKDPSTLVEDSTGHLAEVDILLSAVGRGADRLVRVVDNLLLLARVDDAASPRGRVPVDLAAVVAEVRALMPLASQHRLLLAVDTTSPVWALGDPAELETLVGNLVGNAVKYSADDAPVRVTLTRPSAHEVMLTCTDSGIGIGEADLTRLFEEFFRSEDGQVRREPGTGLGLAIVDRIVNRHGGRVRVESEVGLGTVVSVVLPSSG